MIMTFKEALIAHLQGEKVEVRKMIDGKEWQPFMDRFGGVDLVYVDCDTAGAYTEFRIKPRTVMCNGVEVPAPESVRPKCGASYFMPALHECDDDDMWCEGEWRDSALDNAMMSRGLVYLNREDAIARAKAMLITR